MERAGITDPADVHYVQTKTPLLTLETITDAKSRGHDVWTEDTLKSMDVSNSTTALGIAVALGEIEMPTGRADPQGPVAVLLGRLVLVRRRARPGADRRARQRPRRRRPLPHRPQRDEGRARRRRRLGVDPQTPASSCPSGRTPSDLERPGRQRVLQVRGRPDRPGTRPAQHHARRLRRALAPADQVLRRGSGRVGHRRPGRVRLGRGRAPGPVRRRPGHRHRRALRG